MRRSALLLLACAVPQPQSCAAYNGYAKVIEVLAAAGADVHYTKEGSGETALYYACLQGRLAAVKALIAAKARHSDALFDNQETPLHCAAMGGHAQVVAELLKAGAEHDVTKSDGATPLCETTPLARAPAAPARADRFAVQILPATAESWRRTTVSCRQSRSCCARGETPTLAVRWTRVATRA